MPYEIPAELEYTEKIVFGLTFKQLVIAIPFLLLIFILFKSGLNLYATGILSTLLAALAASFMFFSFDKKLKSFILWKKNTLINARNFNTFIGVKEVKENCFISNDKRKIAILKGMPINFAIKT